jgi:sugar phosphate isomerase/epimerase
VRTTERRQIALATLTVATAAPPELVDAAAEAGFDGVTQRGAPAFPGDAPPLATDPRIVKATIERLAATGLNVLDVEVLRLGVHARVADFEPYLELGARLSAQHVLVTNDDPDPDRSAEQFAQLCAAAAPYNLRPALEFMVYRGTRTVQDAHDVVTRSGHPAGAVLVDALHLQRSGGTPRDVAQLATTAPERYPYAQLCDAPAEPRSNDHDELRREGLEGRLLPGDGELPLAELVNALPGDAALSIESPVPALRDHTPRDVATRAAVATAAVLNGRPR